MIHLTLTGPYAGTPICPVNKVHAKENGDVFYHAEYWHDMKNPDLCPECKREMEIVDAELKSEFDKTFKCGTIYHD